MNQELANIEDSLFKVENLLEEFRVAKKTIDLGVEGQTVFNRLSDVQLEESEEVGKKRYFEYLLDFFDVKKKDGEAKSAMLPPPVVGIADASVVNLINELNTLCTLGQQMSSSLKNRNPQIRTIEAEIVAMEQLLEANVRAAIKQTSLNLVEIRGQIRSMEEKLTGFPTTERNLINIRENPAQ